MTLDMQHVQAASLMASFAERTGLSSDAEPTRYLWTDAFALMNFLSLFRQSGDEVYASLARGLIEQVHHVLGRHRADDPRDGWLSGLSDAEGARHPTRGGLRIGKPLPERQPHQPPNERLEWERDGQYFHYLTKWMDALARAAVVLDEPAYRHHAVELAQAVVPAFLRKKADRQPVGLFWKMSIDLSRPQVSGVNPHDALDGYVTCRQLRATDGRDDALDDLVDLLRNLSQEGQWTTDDPLGLGGLLMDAARLVKLADRTETDNRIICDIVTGVEIGLQHYLLSDPLATPASRRLAFRELGLAIGLQALAEINLADRQASVLMDQCRRQIDALTMHEGYGKNIFKFWAQQEPRLSAPWLDHLDINDVMLSTALLQAYVWPLQE